MGYIFSAIFTVQNLNWNAQTIMDADFWFRPSKFGNFWYIFVKILRKCRLQSAPIKVTTICAVQWQFLVNQIKTVPVIFISLLYCNIITDLIKNSKIESFPPIMKPSRMFDFISPHRCLMLIPYYASIHRQCVNHLL